jgi:dienelactone hydrolase
MRFWRKLVVLAGGAIGVGVALVAWGQQSGDESSALAVVERKADIMSEGVRLHADLYYPEAAGQPPLPAIVMSHGWGGTAAMLSAQATDFARAGYFVIAFDYRGWGESDSRLMLTKPAPDPSQRTEHRFTAEVKEVREVVDPLDQAADIFSVIHWAMGEAMVDRNRIGLWGTSFAGGLVVYVAAREPRVKALVSQVGYMGQPIAEMPASALAKIYDDGTRRARGELDYPPPRAREVGQLQGGPIREKFLLYAPIEDVARAKGCAMLFIATEREDLFDNKRHPELAYSRAGEPKKYVVIPGIAHYDIYGRARQEATRLAIEWFDSHLKK